MFKLGTKLSPVYRTVAIHSSPVGLGLLHQRSLLVSCKVQLQYKPFQKVQLPLINVKKILLLLKTQCKNAHQDTGQIPQVHLLKEELNP